MKNIVAHTVHEYGIEWTSPEDIAGTVTMLDSKWRAQHMLVMTRRLPGGQDGRVVVRTVTYSDFEVVS